MVRHGQYRERKSEDEELKQIETMFEFRGKVLDLRPINQVEGEKLTGLLIYRSVMGWVGIYLFLVQKEKKVWILSFILFIFSSFCSRKF